MAGAEDLTLSVFEGSVQYTLDVLLTTEAGDELCVSICSSTVAVGALIRECLDLARAIVGESHHWRVHLDAHELYAAALEAWAARLRVTLPPGVQQASTADLWRLIRICEQFAPSGFDFQRLVDREWSKRRRGVA